MTVYALLRLSVGHNCFICGIFYLQFSNNSFQENRGTFPLVIVDYVSKKLNFSGNLIVNNTELKQPGDDGSNDRSNVDSSHAVVQLAKFYYSPEVSVSRNQFSNPDAAYELSVDLRLPSSFIVDLGLNFWDQTNYSAVIRRYVYSV